MRGLRRGDMMALAAAVAGTELTNFDPLLGVWEAPKWNCEGMAHGGGIWRQQELDLEIWKDEHFPLDWTFSRLADNPLDIGSRPTIAVMLVHGQQNYEANVAPLGVELIEKGMASQVVREQLKVPIFALRMPNKPCAWQAAMVWQQARFLHLALRQVSKTLRREGGGVLTQVMRGSAQELVPVFLEGQSMGGLVISTFLFQILLSKIHPISPHFFLRGSVVEASIQFNATEATWWKSTYEAKKRDEDGFAVLSWFGLNIPVTEHPLAGTFDNLALATMLKGAIREIKTQLRFAAGDALTSLANLFGPHIFPALSFFVQGGPMDEQVPSPIAALHGGLLSGGKGQWNGSEVSELWDGPLALGRNLPGLELWDFSGQMMTQMMPELRSALNHNQVMMCWRLLHDQFAGVWISLAEELAPPIIRHSEEPVNFWTLLGTKEKNATAPSDLSLLVGTNLHSKISPPPLGFVTKRSSPLQRAVLKAAVAEAAHSESERQIVILTLESLEAMSRKESAAGTTEIPLSADWTVRSMSAMGFISQLSCPSKSRCTLHLPEKVRRLTSPADNLLVVALWGCTQSVEVVLDTAGEGGRNAVPVSCSDVGSTGGLCLGTVRSPKGSSMLSTISQEELTCQRFAVSVGPAAIFHSELTIASSVFLSLSPFRLFRQIVALVGPPSRFTIPRSEESFIKHFEIHNAPKWIVQNIKLKEKKAVDVDVAPFLFAVSSDYEQVLLPSSTQCSSTHCWSSVTPFWNIDVSSPDTNAPSFSVLVVSPWLTESSLFLKSQVKESIFVLVRIFAIPTLSLISGFAALVLFRLQLVNPATLQSLESTLLLDVLCLTPANGTPTTPIQRLMRIRGLPALAFLVVAYIATVILRPVASRISMTPLSIDSPWMYAPFETAAIAVLLMALLVGMAATFEVVIFIRMRVYILRIIRIFRFGGYRLLRLLPRTSYLVVQCMSLLFAPLVTVILMFGAHLFVTVPLLVEFISGRSDTTWMKVCRVPPGTLGVLGAAKRTTGNDPVTTARMLLMISILFNIGCFCEALLHFSNFALFILMLPRLDGRAMSLMMPFMDAIAVRELPPAIVGGALLDVMVWVPVILIIDLYGDVVNTLWTDPDSESIVFRSPTAPLLWLSVASATSSVVIAMSTSLAWTHLPLFMFFVMIMMTFHRRY